MACAARRERPGGQLQKPDLAVLTDLAAQAPDAECVAN
jgi:hypothetical protein